MFMLLTVLTITFDDLRPLKYMMVSMSDIEHINKDKV